MTGEHLLSVSGLICDIIADVVPTIINSYKRGTELVEEIDNAQEVIKAEVVEEDLIEDTIEISDDLSGEITRIANDSKIARRFYTSTAKDTNDLINFAIYYMSNPKAKLLMLKPADKEFINAIGELANFGKIYKEFGVMENIEKQFGAENIEPGSVGDYLFMVKDLHNTLENPEFIVKWTAKKGRCMLYDPSIDQIAGPVKSDTHRVIFDLDTEYKNPELYTSDISDELVYRLEAALLPIIPQGQYHYYRKDEQGKIILHIVKDDCYHAEETFIIDDGSIMGGSSIYVLASYPNQYGMTDTIFVDAVKHQDIAHYVLSSAFNMLNTNQIQIATDDMFDVPVIYRNIDMSNTSWLDNLSEYDKKRLSRNLNACVKTLNGLDLRLRFDSYGDINNFILVSDDLVSSPFKNEGITASDTIPGSVIIVNNEHLTKRIKDKNAEEYNIEYKED